MMPRKASAPCVSGALASVAASAHGAPRISPWKFSEKAEFFVIEQSERATHVSGSTEVAYQVSDRGSPVTEDHIGSAVYRLDATDSAGGTSNTQLFDEAPHPSAP